MIFISGPMTGLDDWNQASFDEAESDLSREWIHIHNPASLFGGDKTRNRAEYMRKNIEALLQAEAMYMLQGWHYSQGARLEFLIAVELGLEIVFQEKAPQGKGRPRPSARSEDASREG